MDSIRWFKARKVSPMPLILLNNRLLTFLYISFESSWDQYIYYVCLYSSVSCWLCSRAACEQSWQGRLFCLISTRHGSSCYGVFVPKRPRAWPRSRPHHELVLVVEIRSAGSDLGRVCATGLKLRLASDQFRGVKLGDPYFAAERIIGLLSRHGSSVPPMTWGSLGCF